MCMVEKKDFKFVNKKNNNKKFGSTNNDRSIYCLKIQSKFNQTTINEYLKCKQHFKR